MKTQTKSWLAFVFFVLVFTTTHFVTFPGSLAHFHQTTQNQQLLDLQPEFSSAAVYQRVEALGEHGRAAYLTTMLTIDTIFPLSAFIFFYFWGKLAAEKTTFKPYITYFWVLPTLYLTADLTENISIMTILLNYPAELPFIPSVLGYISILKRVSMLMALFVPLMLLVARLTGRYFPQQQTA